MGINVTLRGGSGDMQRFTYDPDLNGKIAAAQTEDDVGVPTGAIILWSGAISAIPTGFVICDGTNSTPNLTDRFVIHADNDSGGTNDVGDTGGEQSHTLTVNEIPSHDHLLPQVGGATPGVDSNNTRDYSGTVRSGATGGGAAHENRPKFYALAYVMKT